MTGVTAPSGSPLVASGRQRVSQLQAGDVVGRYQLLLPIATGGMGRVWAARQRGHHGFRKLVALKTALGDLAQNKEFEALFLDEARIASRIEHPHVCSILELGDEGGVLYMVMEWVGGGSLAQLVAAVPERRLDPRVAARIVAQACSGLHAAHELHDETGAPLHVIHRDISPQNILLTPEGHAKVADFGVAKARDQLHQATSTGEVKGKLSYMAPEQFSSKNYDRRVDVFAMACVLYEVTVGARPFSGSGVATIYHILEGQFDAPSKLVPGYPPALEAIVLRGMAKDPADRPATADEFRRALDAWLASSGPPLTEDDVRLVMRAALGAEIEDRSELIRGAMTKLETGEPADARPGGILGNGSVSPAASERELFTDTTANLPGAGVSTRPRPRSSRRGIFLLGLGVVAAMVAGGVVAARSRSPAAARDPSPDRTGAGLTASAAGTQVSALAASASVRLQLRASPPTARVSVDDGAPQAVPYDVTVPRDEHEHVVRFAAPGHEDQRRVVTFSESQTLDVSLARVAGRPGALATAKVPAAASGAVAAPAPADTDVKPGATPKKPARPIDRDDPFKE